MGGADWRDGGAGRYCAVGLARRRFRTTGEGWEGRRGGVSAGEVALSGGVGAIGRRRRRGAVFISVICACVCVCVCVCCAFTAHLNAGPLNRIYAGTVVYSPRGSAIAARPARRRGGTHTSRMTSVPPGPRSRGVGGITRVKAQKTASQDNTHNSQDSEHPEVLRYGTRHVLPDFIILRVGYFSLYTGIRIKTKQPRP